MTPPVVRISTVPDIMTARLATCWYCAHGYRRVAGQHVGSATRKLTQPQACGRIVVVRPAIEPRYVRLASFAYVVFIDGAPLRDRRGQTRRFAILVNAWRAALEHAPNLP